MAGYKINFGMPQLKFQICVRGLFRGYVTNERKDVNRTSFAAFMSFGTSSFVTKQAYGAKLEGW